MPEMTRPMNATPTPSPCPPGGPSPPRESAGAPDSQASLVDRPSSLYRSELWRLGRWAATKMPRSAADQVCRFFGAAYWQFNRRRRQVILSNLLPAVANDRVQAARCGRLLCQQFAVKVADLWRYESGLPVREMVGGMSGFQHLQAARERNRGALLLTPHLGNWELGAPLLASHGIKVSVITLPEPDSRLTELRRAARARWGIQTTVVGCDPFAFVEVIRQLEAGATVALLMDRPLAASATEVQLFGRPFAASLAAAELARASGCLLIPVYLPRVGMGYSARMLSPVPYDRAELGSRPARQRLTQEILTLFQPIIQQHLSQWYHFVPIWRPAGGGPT